MNPERLSASIDDLRKFTGRNLADYCDRSGSPAFRSALREEATADRSRRLWQPSKHPELIYSEGFLATKVTYLHNNPVRAGLVRSPEHWRFSSAGWYSSGGDDECDVVITSLWW
jgi:REP element-mobilizing transposase RayT